MQCLNFDILEPKRILNNLQSCAVGQSDWMGLRETIQGENTNPLYSLAQSCQVYGWNGGKIKDRWRLQGCCRPSFFAWYSLSITHALGAGWYLLNVGPKHWLPSLGTPRC